MTKPTHPPTDADDRSVDATLRAAGARQRRALAPARDDATPALTLRHDAGDRALPAAQPRRRAWRGALAAAAALALLVGGWWALQPGTTPPNTGPIAGTPAPDAPAPPDTATGLESLLAGAWPALSTPLTLPELPPWPRAADAAARLTTHHVTDPLATELDRLQTDLRRVLADLPRVSLRWGDNQEDEPRTERTQPASPLA